MRRIGKSVFAAALVWGLALVAAAAESGNSAQVWVGRDPAARPPRDRVMHVVKPSETDPAITRFDDSHIVMFNRNAAEHSRLVVFMTGTGGKPEGARGFLSVLANQGFRVIGLAYNDEPAVVQVCPQNPDPNCSAQFRQKRIFGDDVTSVVDNTPSEAILSRLVKLLQFLKAQYPAENWGEYLDGSGPDWSKIVISGQSQGAGMAAFIAKQKLVARVVLFSSPWDFSGRARILAPWIATPSVTPPERWFAEYHQREMTADLLAKSYQLLAIPAANIRIFKGEPPAIPAPNPYHATTVSLAEYIPDWLVMFGPAVAP